MKHSQRIIETLVKLAQEDKLPLDISTLDPEIFAFANRPQENIFCYWSTDDILSIAETEFNYELDAEQAQAIADTCQDRWDAGLGWNWEDVREAVQEFLDENEDEEDEN